MVGILWNRFGTDGSIFEGSISIKMLVLPIMVVVNGILHLAYGKVNTYIHLGSTLLFSKKLYLYNIVLKS